MSSLVTTKSAFVFAIQNGAVKYKLQNKNDGLKRFKTSVPSYVCKQIECQSKEN